MWAKGFVCHTLQEVHHPFQIDRLKCTAYYLGLML